MNIWIITEKNGAIISAHCLGCKAGLGKTCAHVASALFYIEAITRIQGKLACMQVRCTWVLPTYLNELPYARAKDIDFSSAQKLKTILDRKIESLPPNAGEEKYNYHRTNPRTTIWFYSTIRKRNGGGLCLTE